MTIFSVFNLLGGLAMFLFGMQVMSTGLTKLSGSKLEQTISSITSNKYKSIAFGAIVTVAMQSSSAVTVMLVGLVNSGFMQLGQTIGVIMGTNIGTTFTAWILSLMGIQGGNFFVKMLNPTAFSPLLAIIGIMMAMLSKSTRKRDVGNIMVGFAVLMFGMTTMSSSVAPLADIPEFTRILVMFSNPLLGVIVGAVFTGIIQSSAASVGILQAFSMTGTLSYGAAIPIVMGQNIGTCVTALISSIGANKSARRVAIVHICFNVIGTIVLLVLLYIARSILQFPFENEPISPVGIAVVHSIFNVASTLILIPFTALLEKLACIIVRDKKGDKEKVELFDDRLLLTPTVAVERCREVTLQMASLAKESLLLSLDMISRYDEKTAALINENEMLIDRYEDKLGTYLIKIGRESLDPHNGREVSMMLQNIGDFERIGDHAINVLRAARELDEKGLTFSDSAQEELAVLFDAVREILNNSYQLLERRDFSMARRVEPLEDVIDELRATIRARHIGRLRDGLCTLEVGFIFVDILTNLERVADHCSNVAVCLIEISEGLFDTHKYLRKMKSSESFTVLADEYRQKYMLPDVQKMPEPSALPLGGPKAQQPQ